MLRAMQTPLGCGNRTMRRIHPPFPFYLNVALSFHSFHELIQKTQPYQAEFRDRLIRAGIHRVGFLRHGNTLPSPTGIDFDRVLSDTGREQAAEAGSSFGRQNTPFYHTMLVSPAPRTMETAEIFSQRAAEEQDRSVTLKPISALYDGVMQPNGSAIFKKIGYAPLSAYVDNKEDIDREQMRLLLSDYAFQVITAIHHTVLPDSAESSLQIGLQGSAAIGTILWIVGHAIYLPSAALGVAYLIGSDDSAKEIIMNTITGEAEGYLIHTTDTTVHYLKRPSSLQS